MPRKLREAEPRRIWLANRDDHGLPLHAHLAACHVTSCHAACVLAALLVVIVHDCCAAMKMILAAFRYGGSANVSTSPK